MCVYIAAHFQFNHSTILEMSPLDVGRYCSLMNINDPNREDGSTVITQKFHEISYYIANIMVAEISLCGVVLVLNIRSLILCKVFDCY